MPAADLIIEARVFTGGEPAFAEAVAVAGERILAVGGTAAVGGLAGPATTVIRRPGALVTPGFNDAHVHMLEGGESLVGLDLRTARSAAEVRERIAAQARALPAGSWILRGSWDHEAWPDRRRPRRELIDPVTPGHPVFVTRVDGHMALCNSRALAAVGIGRDTPDPPGGLIERDAATGEPTGIVIDTAMEAVARVAGTPAPRPRLEAALAHAARLGVTSVQDNCDPAVYPVYEQLLAEGRLTARVDAWFPITERARLATAPDGGATGGRWLRRGTVKVYADGSLGARSAWLAAPYADDPATSGLAIYEEAELGRLIREADAAGLTVACHAIGDRANAAALAAFAAAQAANPPRPRRHRIEHAQVVRAADLARFRPLGIVASVQPSHALSDLRWAAARLGPRLGDAYRLGSFLRAGIAVAFGTDWYVEPLDPRRTLYAAAGGELPAGAAPGAFLEERIALAEAIRAYTRGSAWAQGLDEVKGTIAPGYLADLTVFAEDLFALPPRAWLETSIVLTVVGGRIVHQL